MLSPTFTAVVKFYSIVEKENYITHIKSAQDN